MTWETHPVTPDRFEDFADVVNRTRRANHCWCLSHRLRIPEIEELGGGSREQAMRRLCEREHPPGVVTYRDGEPVGWCNLGPRTEITRLAGSRLIRPVDDLPVWSIVCVVVRPGHRRQGVTGPLVEGAVAYAASHGAPAVEAYPVDPPGRMDLTMAFVGTRSMFDRAGFRVVGTTDAVASGMPRLVMRRDLPRASRRPGPRGHGGWGGSHGPAPAHASVVAAGRLDPQDDAGLAAEHTGVVAQHVQVTVVVLAEAEHGDAGVTQRADGVVVTDPQATQGLREGP